LFSHTGNVLVANAVKKYGLNEFVFLVLEIVPQEEESNNTQNSIALLNREDHYIQTLCPEYNIAPLASNSSGWNHTEETKEKMQENYSDERRQRVAEINKGKTLSDETKALLREAALNRKPMSIETRLKCIVNVRPVTITELNGSNPQFFPTIVSAAQAIGCSVKTIQRALLFHFALQNEKAGYVSQSFARRVVLYGPTAHQNKLRDWIP
jgi:group I intron endonuclease